ncbi:hypothetical protein QFC22_003154 [Naganishia vaughanmartiniae]|uniref:Uncharacterized protein n=1 Tax=Naganishia vaughanmartiniae TaxID=1424756 RepID=A0ACC2XA64_9TREE|nr:hypothetical protein QFC22_003154 [Naganishia vaughanmartiniae]
MRTILDSRIWSEPVGPPALPPPANSAQPSPHPHYSRFNSALNINRGSSPAPSTGSGSGSKMSFGLGRHKDDKKKDHKDDKRKEKEERKTMDAMAAAMNNGNSKEAGGDGKKKGLFKMKW